jgi:HD superfamily phosphodiesterase
MTSEQINAIEQHVLDVGGPDKLSHGKRVLHLARLIAAKESLDFNEDALIFASYLHDLAAYSPYRPEGEFDHAHESARLVPRLAAKFALAPDAVAPATDAIENHNKAGQGHGNECKLVRNADALDYLGYLAVARDFAKQPTDMKLAMAALRKRKDQFLPLIDLNFAIVYAKPRLAELDYFISRFEEETFGIY